MRPDDDSRLDKALRQFEATEANLEKLERTWMAIRKLIPDDIQPVSDDEYEDLTRVYCDIRDALPKIDGWRPSSSPPDLDDLAQNRFDAREIGELSAIIAVERDAEERGREVALYRHRFNKRRRQLVRDILKTRLDLIDGHLQTLARDFPVTETLPLPSVTGAAWDNLTELVRGLDVILGSSITRPARWNDLMRHLGFGKLNDLWDIISFDWPNVAGGINKQLYDPDEPIPVDAEDLGALVDSHPRGPITTKLNWANLSPEDFERLLFVLISSVPGYENPEWLTSSNAPDRGRDLAVTRVFQDHLSGVIRSRIIIQCKHWLSRSVSLAEVAILKEQMPLWEPPKVNVLIIATSGRFTTDAVQHIETHNGSDRALRIEMWPESHLERLLASRPGLIGEFKLR